MLDIIINFFNLSEARSLDVYDSNKIQIHPTHSMIVIRHRQVIQKMTMNVKVRVLRDIADKRQRVSLY